MYRTLNKNQEAADEEYDTVYQAKICIGITKDTKGNQTCHESVAICYAGLRLDARSVELVLISCTLHSAHGVISSC